MNEPARLPHRRSVALGGALVVILAFAASPSRAQTFAAGVGGTLMNDRSSAGSPSNFSRGGFFAFGEIRLERETVLQVRVQRFYLPGAEAAAPKVRVDGASLTVAYTFQEDWFEAGFFGGGGVYRVVPNQAGADEVATDLRENAWGLTGGVLSIFRISGNLDFRLEGGVTYVAATYAHTPIVLGASLGYRF